MIGRTFELIAGERALGCALAAFLTVAGAAAALAVPEVQLTAEQTASYQQMDENTRVRLLIDLARQGQHETVAVLMQRYPLTGPLAANRTLFLQGMIAKGRGKLTLATEKFRAALAADPSLTLVRAELAETLFLLEEDDSAKHHLSLLMGAAPNETAASGIKSFIDRIDARRPYTISAFVSVAPSTNINNGTQNKKIYDDLGVATVSTESRAQSGIGLSAGLDAGYSKRLSEDIAAVVGAGVYGRVYRDNDFNQFVGSTSAELRYLNDAGYIGAGAVASVTFSGEDPGMSYWGLGPRLSLSRQLTPQDSLNASTTFEFRHYPDLDMQNGYASLNSLSLVHAFSSDLLGFARGNFSRVETGLDYLDNWSFGGSIGVYKELPHGITANADLAIQRTAYDADWPNMTDPRDDTRYTGTISLTKRDLDLFGYAPVIEYSYSYNDSNVGLYQYDSHTVDFRLTKDF